MSDKLPSLRWSNEAVIVPHHRGCCWTELRVHEWDPPFSHGIYACYYNWEHQHTEVGWVVVTISLGSMEPPLTNRGTHTRIFVLPTSKAPNHSILMAFAFPLPILSHKSSSGNKNTLCSSSTLSTFFEVDIIVQTSLILRTIPSQGNRHHT